MKSLSNELKNKIYHILRDNDDMINYAIAEGQLMNILSDIYHIYHIPDKSDNRYTNLGENIQQHFINNDDYPIDDVFINKLHILEDDELFIKFFISIINLNVKANAQDSLSLKYIKNILSSEDLQLLFKTDGTIVGIEQININVSWSDIKKNEIPIFVQIKKTQWIYNKSSFNIPNQLPCFVLVNNDEWNDYSTYSQFGLHYCSDKNNDYYIGEVKIIHSDKANVIKEMDDNGFYSLSSAFTSLGQTSSYYINLKEVLKEKSWSILKALNDVACFHEIESKWINHPYYMDSLLRFDTAERAKRTAIYNLKGYSIDNAFNFSFYFKPKYGDNKIKINFHFDFGCDTYKRIIGIIGENGVGKTTLLNNLPISISKEIRGNFEGNIPLFSVR